MLGVTGNSCKGVTVSLTCIVAFAGAAAPPPVPSAAGGDKGGQGEDSAVQALQQLAHNALQAPGTSAENPGAAFAGKLAHLTLRCT